MGTPSACQPTFGLYYSGRSSSRLARFKRSRAFQIAAASVLAPLLAVSTAVATTGDPALSLYEVDGMVLVSGKHFGTSQAVTVEATVKNLKSASKSKTNTNQLGSFKIAIEVDARDGDRVEIEASTARDFRAATLVFGEGQLEPTASNPSAIDIPRDEPVDEPSNDLTPPFAEEPASKPDSDFVTQVIDLTNQERANAGLDPLTRDGCLTEAAQYWSDAMSRDRFFEHSNLQPLIGQCNLSTVGENIAYGYNKPENVVQGWMNSPSHRKNILTPSFTKIGVGYAPNGAYATQQFGR